MQPAVPAVTSTRPVPAAVDQALKAALPEVFNAAAAQQPSALSLAPLTEALGALHLAYLAAGESGDLMPLVAALSDSVCLSGIAARGTKEAHEEAIGVLDVLASTVLASLGLGRDGAALAALYGHSPVLDRGVDALRTEAATRFMLAHEVRRLGLGDAAALPAPLRECVCRDAHALTARESEIAQTKLEIVRALGAGNGFVPAMAGLRFTPQLAQGLRQVNGKNGKPAGVLIGALTGMERALAESPEGRRMLGCVEAQQRLQQAKSEDATLDASLRSTARADAAYLQKRAAALGPQSVSTGLSEHELSALGADGLKPLEAEALLMKLARMGLSDVNEVQKVIESSSKVMGQFQQAAAGGMAKPKPALRARQRDQEWVAALARGEVLANSILSRLGGPSGLAGLAEPDSPLAGNSLAGDQRAPAYQRLQDIADQCAAQGEELERLRQRLNDKAHAQRVIQSFEGFRVPAPWARRVDDLPEQASNEVSAWQQSLEVLMTMVRGRIDVLMEGRSGLLGPQTAGTLRAAVRAAALMTCQRRPAPVAADGRAHRDRQSEAAAIEQVLRGWGLSPGVAAPEIEQVLARPIDAACIDQWVAEFTPTPGAMQDVATAAHAKLAQPQPPGKPTFDSATLGRLLQDLDKLEVGSCLTWDIKGKRSAITPHIPVGYLPAIGSVRVLVAAHRHRERGVQISRTADAYELMLRGGSGLAISVEACASLSFGLSKILQTNALVEMEGEGHRLAGVVLEFPGTGSGYVAMQDLLRRMVAKGRVDAQDLVVAKGVVPVIERMVGGSASAVAELRLFAPLAGDTGGLHFAPAAGIRLTAGVHRTDESRSNHRRNERVHEWDFTVNLEAEADLRFQFKDFALESEPHTKEICEVSCKLQAVDVREAGLVSTHTERVARVPGSAAYKEAIIGHLGGPTFRAMLAQWRTSGRSEDQARLDCMETLVRNADPHREIGIRWRIADGPRKAANTLLQKARVLRNRPTGHRIPVGHAVQHAIHLEKQAQVLLDDPRSYMLHGLDVETSEEATATLNKFKYFEFVKWEKTLKSERTQRTASIVFDPDQVRAAQGSH